METFAGPFVPFHGVFLVPELSANGSQNIYGGATIGISHETEVRLWERLGRILLQHFQQAVKISPLSGVRPGENAYGGR